jgi:hypothetical protein
MGRDSFVWMSPGPAAPPAAASPAEFGGNHQRQG